MANFKAGDRVRIRMDIPESGCAFETWRYRGVATTIVKASEQSGPGYWVLDIRHHIFDADVSAHESALEPLTPPAEDTWAADAVRKVTKPQHVEPEVAERLREFDRIVGVYGATGAI